MVAENAAESPLITAELDDEADQEAVGGEPDVAATARYETSLEMAQEEVQQTRGRSFDEPQAQLEQYAASEEPSGRASDRLLVPSPPLGQNAQPPVPPLAQNAQPAPSVAQNALPVPSRRSVSGGMAMGLGEGEMLAQEPARPNQVQANADVPRPASPALSGAFGATEPSTALPRRFYFYRESRIANASDDPSSGISKAGSALDSESAHRSRGAVATAPEGARARQARRQGGSSVSRSSAKMAGQLGGMPGGSVSVALKSSRGTIEADLKKLKQALEAAGLKGQGWQETDGQKKLKGDNIPLRFSDSLGATELDIVVSGAPGTIQKAVDQLEKAFASKGKAATGQVWVSAASREAAKASSTALIQISVDP